jgi:hypothetical protein
MTCPSYLTFDNGISFLYYYIKGPRIYENIPYQGLGQLMIITIKFAKFHTKRINLVLKLKGARSVDQGV